MFPKLLASRGAFFFFMSQTLIMTVVIAGGYLLQLITDPFAIIAEKMYKDSETIAILLIAVGVLLECRETLLKRAMREQRRDDDALRLGTVDHDLEYYGVVLLILGLTMELIIAITNYLNEHIHSNFFYAKIETAFNIFTFGVLCVIMFISILSMICIGFLFFKLKK